MDPSTASAQDHPQDPIHHQEHDHHNDATATLNQPSEPSFFVEALYAFNGTDTASLSFHKGDIIEVLTQLSSGWWDGVVWRQRERGWFPSNYVRRITEAEAELARSQLELPLANQNGDENETITEQSFVPLRANHTSTSSQSSQLSVASSIWDGRGQIHGGIESGSRNQLEGSSSNPLNSTATNNDNRIKQTSSSRLAEPRESKNWVGWLPRVTDEGRIQYYNTLTGELASEMPSADDELELEEHQPLQTSRPQSPLSDPLAFLEDHGFGQEILVRHGILRSNPAQQSSHLKNQAYSSTHPPKATTGYSTSRLSISTLTPTHLLANDSNRTHLSLSKGSNLDGGNGSLFPGATLSTPAFTSSGLSSVAPRRQEDGSLTRSATHSVRRNSPLKASVSTPGLSDRSANDVFTISESIKARLGKSLAVPPTPSLAQLKSEVKTVIDDLAGVTAPHPDSLLAKVVSQDPWNEAALITLQARLSSCLSNLGTKIRGILQASCQLDTAVLSVLRDPFASAGFATLLPTLIPPSPYYANQAESSSSTSNIPHHNRPASPTTSFSTGFSADPSNPVYPELKPVTRKIASTLSKLTLSTRALWGLLSTPIKPPSNAPELNSFDGFPAAESVDPAHLAAHHRLSLYTRYTLEQKLRSECKMGVNDLNANVETFFNHLEAVLRESKRQVKSPNALVQSYRSPRHAIGHMSMPLESLFLPGGAKGGSWKASGFTTSMSITRRPPSMPASENSSNMPNSPRVRLTLEWYSQQLSRMVQEATEITKATAGLLPSDDRAQEDLLGSSSSLITMNKRLPDGGEEAWVDTLYSHVSKLLGSIGTLLSTSETIDLLSSVDMDLDQFLWLDAQRALARKNSSGALSSENLIETLHRLHSSRQLVNEFQKSKQALYELVAELAQASQSLIIYPNHCSSVPALSPAQPPAASPLFTVYTPTLGEPSGPQLSVILENIVTGLENFHTTTQSLAIEADEQCKLGPDFANNKNVKLALTTKSSNHRLSDSSTSKFLSIDARKSSRRSQSLAGAGRSTSTASNSTPPTSPRLHCLSRGIEEEQVEQDETSDNLTREDPSTDSLPGHVVSIQRQSLQLSSFDSSSGVEIIEKNPRDDNVTKRTSGAAASVWSYRTCSSTKSLELLPTSTNTTNGVGAGGGNIKGSELPSLPLDPDRPESGSSWSPTRSRKLAKFFGEETAGQIPPSKVAPGKPTFLWPDYGPEDISFNVDNQVRGGSLKGLVIKLTSHEGPDVPFLRVFLMTYRTFTTSHDFLDLLIERYHQQPPPDLTADELKMWSDQKQKVIKIRVINVIRTWIESHLSDEDAEGVLGRVTEFAARDMGDTSLSKQITLTCERRQARGHSSKMIPVNPPGNPPPSIIPRNTRKIKFLDIDPLELARQLSLVESKLFCQIQANECLGKAWPKEFAKEGTPNIKAMIDMSNSLTRWVAETILCQTEQKKRANTIKHFILIAERCRALNNFSTLMQIIAGLNSTPIYRLRRTWETIPHKTLALFGQLGVVMSPTKNYATYRDTIRNMAPPCVPFVGVYLTDWTFIGDGNPDFLREKPHQINFNKRQKAAELIVQIQSYQSMPYQLTPVPVIVKFLEDSLESPRDEKELYDMSLDIEPRERDDEKIARLLAESGFL